MLSYKKPSKAPKSKSPATIDSAKDDTSTVPNHPTQRVVLSRRRALQDFYNLPQANQGSIDHTSETPTETQGQSLQTVQAEEKENYEHASDSHLDNISLQVAQLNDPVELDNFIKRLDVGELLKIRNHISNGLNQHDLEKKSMVYDNYSELIKLSDTLAALNDGKGENNAGFSLYSEETIPLVTSNYIDTVFTELTSILETDASVFNQEFQKVVETISANFDGADSLASLNGIMGGHNEN